MKAIRMINDLCLFSANEDLDEVSTSEMKWVWGSVWKFCGHP